MRIFLPLILLVFIASCKQDPNASGSDKGSVKDMENRIAQLELENSMKDSVINESLSFFNEIKTNLEAIGVRRDQIRQLSENPELQEEDKQWILEEILKINYLREDNARLMKQLNDQMKKNGVNVKALEEMISSMKLEIQWKDEQINLLQTELERLDEQYSALFDAYQEQAVQVDQLTDELNTVHYAYGSAEELTSNKIISKKTGFIGIGKRLELRSDFNDSYFTEANASKTKTITVRGENIRLLTDHAPASYKLVKNGPATQIVIMDPSQFWKISKYLVVLVDA